jgi:hypothetical protein
VGDDFVLLPPRLVPLRAADYDEAVSLLARLLAEAAAGQPARREAQPAGQLVRLRPNTRPQRQRRKT